ncbi:MAG TPA: DUF4097 family beta strand repeat-containing protein [Bacteroidales bacterium]|nr:DUF4097 family beta strand repeat-containing protein [Bacteroidales bacterium]
MKTNRFGILTLLIFLFALKLPAQDYKIAAPTGRDGKVILKNFSGPLPVEGYQGNEILVSSTEGKPETPERARGLKPVYPGGTDNTGLGLSVQKEGNTVMITCLLPFTRSSGYSLRIPENLSIELESGCEYSNSVSITGIKNEIAIKSCHGIDLKNITGPVVLSSISGDINISFGSTISDKTSSINAISGDVDITLPSKTQVSIDLSTINGAFYSDFDIADTQKNMKRIGGNNLNFDLNGGGFKFDIVTVSGNVYLRKGM